MLLYHPNLLSVPFLHPLPPLEKRKVDSLYASEQNRQESKKARVRWTMSAQQVLADQVIPKHGSSITRATVSRYVNNGEIGVAKKCGASGQLLENVYPCKLLLEAARSRIQLLLQLEGIKTVSQKNVIDALIKEGI